MTADTELLQLATIKAMMGSGSNAVVISAVFKEHHSAAEKKKSESASSSTTTSSGNNNSKTSSINNNTTPKRSTISSSIPGILQGIPLGRRVALKIMSHFWDENAKKLLDCERRTLKFVPPHPGVIRMYRECMTYIPSHVVPYLTSDMQVAVASAAKHHHHAHHNGGKNVHSTPLSSSHRSQSSHTSSSSSDEEEDIVSMVNTNTQSLNDTALFASKHTTQCFVMEYHPTTLDSLRTVWPLPLPWHILHSISESLIEVVAHLQANNVGHLDFKLDNILVGVDGVCVVTDFGISRIFDDERNNSDNNNNNNKNSSRSVTGTGTGSSSSPSISSPLVLPPPPMSLVYKEPFGLLMNRLVLAPEVLQQYERAKQTWKVYAKAKSDAAAASASTAAATVHSTSTPLAAAPPRPPPPSVSISDQTINPPQHPAPKPIPLSPFSPSIPSSFFPEYNSAPTSPLSIPQTQQQQQQSSASASSSLLPGYDLERLTRELTIHFAGQAVWSVGTLLYELAVGYCHEPSYPDDGGGMRKTWYSVRNVPPLPVLLAEINKEEDEKKRPLLIDDGEEETEGEEEDDEEGRGEHGQQARSGRQPVRLQQYQATSSAAAASASSVVRLRRVGESHRVVRVVRNKKGSDRNSNTTMIDHQINETNDDSNEFLNASRTSVARSSTSSMGGQDSGSSSSSSSSGTRKKHRAGLYSSVEDGSFRHFTSNGYPSAFIGLVMSMLDADPNRRITIHDALEVIKALQPAYTNTAATTAAINSSPPVTSSSSSSSSGVVEVEPRKVYLPDGSPFPLTSSLVAVETVPVDGSTIQVHDSQIHPIGSCIIPDTPSSSSSSSSSSTAVAVAAVEEGEPLIPVLLRHSSGVCRIVRVTGQVTAAQTMYCWSVGQGLRVTPCISSSSSGLTHLLIRNNAKKEEAGDDDKKGTNNQQEGDEKDEDEDNEEEVHEDHICNSRIFLGGLEVGFDDSIASLVHHMTPVTPGAPPSSHMSKVYDEQHHDTKVAKATKDKKKKKSNEEGTVEATTKTTTTPIGKKKNLKNKKATQQHHQHHRENAEDAWSDDSEQEEEEDDDDDEKVGIPSNAAATEEEEEEGDKKDGTTDTADWRGPLTDEIIRDSLARTGGLLILDLVPLEEEVVCMNAQYQLAILSQVCAVPKPAQKETLRGEEVEVEEKVLKKGSGVRQETVTDVFIRRSKYGKTKEQQEWDALEASGGSSGGNSTNVFAALDTELYPVLPIPPPLYVSSRYNGGSNSSSSSSSSDDSAAENDGNASPPPLLSTSRATSPLPNSPSSSLVLYPSAHAPANIKSPSPEHLQSLLLWCSSYMRAKRTVTTTAKTATKTTISPSTDQRSTPTKPFLTVSIPTEHSSSSLSTSSLIPVLARQRITVDMREALLYRILLALTGLSNTALKEATTPFPYAESSCFAVRAVAWYSFRHETVSAAVGLLRNISCVEQPEPAEKMVAAGALQACVQAFYGLWRDYSSVDKEVQEGGGGGRGEAARENPLETTPPPLPRTRSSTLGTTSSIATTTTLMRPVSASTKVHGQNPRTAEDCILSASNLLRFEEIQLNPHKHVPYVDICKMAVDAMNFAITPSSSSTARSNTTNTTNTKNNNKKKNETNEQQPPLALGQGLSASALTSAATMHIAAMRLLRYVLHIDRDGDEAAAAASTAQGETTGATVTSPVSASVAMVRAGAIAAITHSIALFPTNKAILEPALHIICSLLIAAENRRASLFPLRACAEAVVTVMSRREFAKDTAILGLAVTVLRNLACVTSDDPIVVVPTPSSSSSSSVTGSNNHADAVHVSGSDAVIQGRSRSRTDSTSTSSNTGINNNNNNSNPPRRHSSSRTLSHTSSASSMGLHASDPYAAPPQQPPLSIALSPALIVTEAGAATVLENVMSAHPDDSVIQESGRCALYNLLLIGANDARDFVGRAVAVERENEALRQKLKAVALIHAVRAGPERPQPFSSSSSNNNMDIHGSSPRSRQEHGMMNDALLLLGNTTAGSIDIVVSGGGSSSGGNGSSAAALTHPHHPQQGTASGLRQPSLSRILEAADDENNSSAAGYHASSKKGTGDHRRRGHGHTNSDDEDEDDKEDEDHVVIHTGNEEDFLHETNNTTTTTLTTPSSMRAKRVATLLSPATTTNTSAISSATQQKSVDVVEIEVKPLATKSGNRSSAATTATTTTRRKSKEEEGEEKEKERDVEDEEETDNPWWRRQFTAAFWVSTTLCAGAIGAAIAGFLTH